MSSASSSRFKSRLPPAANRSGAVDESDFKKAFSDHPSISISTFRQLEAEIGSIQADLENDKVDWEVKITSVKKLRGLIENDASEYDGFVALFKRLEEPMKKAVCDLRSQVCREACVSISYAAVMIRSQLDRFVVAILPSLFTLLPNSAKVMSTSAHTCFLFIIKSVQSPIVVPIFVQTLSSRSSVIRRRCSEYLTEILQTWPAKCLEKHAQSLQDSVVKMIADSDQGARTLGRSAYWHFCDHFKKRGEQIWTGFDANTRKLVNQSKPGGGTGTKASTSSISSTLSSRAFHASAPDLSGERMSSWGRPQRKAPTPYHYRPATTTHGQRSHSDVASPVHTLASKPTTTDHRQHHHQHPSSSSQRKAVAESPAHQHHHHPPPPPSPLPTNDPVRTWIETGHAAAPSATQAFINRLATPKRRRTPGKPAYLSKDALESMMHHRLHSSSENDDETGSVASDVSFSSAMSEITSSKFNLIEDFDEILLLANSSSWSDRKDSVLSLHHLFHTTKTFSKFEIKKITDACKRFFVEPHAKVFVLYLDMLCDFVRIFKSQLTFWMFVLLLRLLHKMGGDLRGSVSRKMTETLHLVRESFDPGLQFNTILKIMLDQTQPMNNKVKLAVLHYLIALIPQMDSEVVQNVSDIRLGVGKIITLTTEQKSLEVRRLSAKVLVALFEVNTATFMMILAQLSKHFRDVATKVLQVHMKKDVGSTAPPATPQKSSSGEYPVSRSRPGSGERREGRVTSPSPLAATPQLPHMKTGIPLFKHKAVASVMYREGSVRRKSPSTGTPPQGGLGYAVATATVATPVVRETEREERESSPKQPSVATSAVYNPLRYEEKHNGRMSDDMEEQSDEDEAGETRQADSNLLRDLSSSGSNSTIESALGRLIHIAKEDSFRFWEKHFDVVLTKIYAHLKHETNAIRILTIRALYEILMSQPVRFASHTETLVLTVLESTRDSNEAVTKAMDELIGPLSRAIEPVECVGFLLPIIAKEDHPVLLFAIKIITKVIERLSDEELTAFLPRIMPVLVTAYSHSASSVRKASVFCMVSVHFAVGERMMEYTVHLTSSQMKLLNLYIKRAEAQATSPTSPDGR